jgi:DNA-damage-inducible protein D
MSSDVSVPRRDGDRTLSPFESIKEVDADGDERWSARELMPLMDYGRWHEFSVIVEKAKNSLNLVQGSDQAEHHFVICHSDGGRWGNQRLGDYRLTRFAAYLTAMAGDDTKEAVAHARVYFAVRTREAEIAPRSQIAVLRLALDQIEAAEQAAGRAEATATETSARLDAIEGRHEWFAALGYAKLRGLATDHRSLNLLGQAAARIGRSSGLTANRVQHALFGEVNHWPRWVWDAAADELGWATA